MSTTKIDIPFSFSFINDRESYDCNAIHDT